VSETPDQSTAQPPDSAPAEPVIRNLGLTLIAPAGETCSDGSC